MEIENNIQLTDLWNGERSQQREEGTGAGREEASWSYISKIAIQDFNK
jgi:hypothetical protein